MSYSVGRFAELFGISVRTLHHYDDAGAPGLPRRIRQTPDGRTLLVLSPFDFLAALADPFTVTGILCYLGLPATAPPLTPARSPPRRPLALDAGPLLDLDQTLRSSPRASHVRFGQAREASA